MHLILALALFLAPDTTADLSRALTGSWVGYLEYRDYSEPPTSAKRVQLPTWLTVTQSDRGLVFHYTYDDGPNKVVDSQEFLKLDTARNTYTVSEPGHPDDIYTMSGLDALKTGLGTLVLTGSGTDNGKPAERRITLRVHRNMVEWLLETRPAQSSSQYTFRHLYRFTRAQPSAN